MKKIISVLLALTMIFSMSAMMSFAVDDAVTVIFATDTHYDYDMISKLTDKPTLQVDEKTGDYDIDTAFITQEDTYSHISASGQMLYESGAILDEFLRQAKENSKCKIVVLSGDLTENGSQTASEAMASKLREFENSTGKSVYVIPGNRDVQTLSKAQFKEVYGAFGYAEALNKDSASASYTADIGGDYRLLMIDSTGAANGGHQFDDARINWIKAQCEQAKNDRKHLIAVMHHNLLQHFAFDLIREGSIIDDSYGLKELFCEYDVKYTFSGHTHAQDIMQYEGKNGNIIYEVVSGALNAYPVSYRVVDFGSSAVKFSTKSITSVDTSEFAEMGISEEAITHANSDFKGYAHTGYRVGIKELFSKTLCTATLKKYLDINYESNQEVARIIDKVGAKLEEILHMPLYDKDKDKISVNVQATDPITGELMYDETGAPVMVARYSVQEITESYGGILPPTHYKNLLDVMVLLYETHVAGGKGLTLNSDEYFIVTHGLAAALNYCLYSISEGEYGILIKFVANKFEPTLLGKLPASLYAYMAGGKQGFEQNIIFMTYLVSPFVKSMVTDSIPSDRDVSLGAYKKYAEPVNPEEKPTNPPVEEPKQEDNSFRAKLVAFFDDFADFFRMIFKILTFQDIF